MPLYFLLPLSCHTKVDPLKLLFGQVRNSVKLKRVMQAILSLGNALNHGTARGKFYLKILVFSYTPP